MRRFASSPTIIIIVILFVATLFDGGYQNPIDRLMSMMLIIPGVIIGLSFHEFAHALVAYKLGDDTPYCQDRVTISPLAHIDPIGLLCLWLVGFGWGVPVEINPNNFRHRRRDEFLVSIAGVTMNFLLAIAFAGVWRVLYMVMPDMMFYGRMGGIVSEIMFGIVSINIVLMIFNLIPVPPLDGFGIITQIFDLRNTKIYWTLYNNGFIILLVLILFGATDKILTPLHSVILNFVLGLFF